MDYKEMDYDQITQLINEYNDEHTNRYAELRRTAANLKYDLEKIECEKNKVYIKLMDGKHHVPNYPNITKYFKELDQEFGKLNAEYEQKEIELNEAIQTREDFKRRLQALGYVQYYSDMVTAQHREIQQYEEGNWRKLMDIKQRKQVEEQITKPEEKSKFKFW